METQPTAENLAKVLEVEGLPDLAARARANEFHDYCSWHALPEIQLANELAWAGRTDLSLRVMNGEFDASREESEAWARSPEGAEAFGELFGRRPGPPG